MFRWFKELWPLLTDIVDQSAAHFKDLDSKTDWLLRRGKEREKFREQEAENEKKTGWFFQRSAVRKEQHLIDELKSIEAEKANWIFKRGKRRENFRRKNS